MSQLTPLVACSSIVSSVIVKGTLAVHRVVRNLGNAHLGGALTLAR